MVVIEDSDEEVQDELQQPQPSSVERRRPRQQLSVEKSHSFEALPEWVKPRWESQLIPSIIEEIGAEDDSWDLEHGGEQFFLQVAQRSLNKVYPQRHHTLTRSDKIARGVRMFLYSHCCLALTVIGPQLRQHVYTWRTLLQRGAIKSVKTAVLKKFGKKPSRPAVKKWVREALLPNGEAFWGRPDPKVSKSQ